MKSKNEQKTKSKILSEVKKMKEQNQIIIKSTTKIPRLVKTILFTLAIYVLCTAFCFLLDYLKIDNLNFIMIYILGVLFVAIFSEGNAVSVLFSVICVATYNFFFTSPRFSLAVFDLKYIVTFIIMLAISVIVSSMTFNLKKKLMEINLLTMEKFKIEKEKERETLKATMLRSVSHDLRTPLTSIGSGAELLLENQNLTEAEQRAILKNISEGARWTIRLVENLLLLTKVESKNLAIHLEDEAVEEIIPQAIRNIAEIKGDREIYVEIPKELMLVKMDATLIIQLISNILQNAIKFTKDDGKIRIQVFNTGRESVFRIYNDGEKLTDEQVEKIFDLYYTNSDRASTGIGLAVCKAIVIAHKGKISARNSDAGVVFEFSLPMSKEK